MFFDHFFPPDIVTAVSDRSIDFTLPADGVSLTRVQQAWVHQYVSPDVDLIYSPRQIHGDVIVDVNQSFLNDPKLFMADAIVTAEKNIAIGVRTADCLPIFICDVDRAVIALVHAGWRGTLDCLATKTIEHMIDIYGSDPGKIKVGLGPCIGKDVYEVGDEFLDFFPEHVHRNKEKCFMDLMGANVAQLKKMGVMEICNSDQCTYSLPKYHSYRRDGDSSGRILSVMMIKEKI